MQARLQLAVLDHNHNVGRKQAAVKRRRAANKGEARYRYAYSKRSKKWVMKEVKEGKKDDHVSEMQLNVLEMQRGDRELT